MCCQATSTGAHMKRLRLFLAAIWLYCPDASTIASEPLRFNRDVRPILSENCFQCHGPDQAKRKADLRLDENAWSTSTQLDANDILARITDSDSDSRMPPKQAGKRLSDEQITLIRRWLDEGAQYEKHWAYIPPFRPSIPDVVASSGSANSVVTSNPIDQFVLARLTSEGRASAPKADRHTLLRRVSFDLTGLPPTEAESTCLCQ